jgi:hypothetical protein
MSNDLKSGSKYKAFKQQGLESEKRRQGYLEALTILLLITSAKSKIPFDRIHPLPGAWTLDASRHS